MKLGGFIKGCIKDVEKSKKEKKNPIFSVNEKKLEEIWGVKKK